MSPSRELRESPRGRLAAVLAAALLAAAWWTPGSGACAGLGWLAAIVLAALPRVRRPYRWSFCFGVLVHVLGFYWLFETIRHFGHFPTIPAGLVFGFFAAASSLQFLLFVFLSRHGRLLSRLSLAVPVAWCIAETFSIRIFPWRLGHTQLAFTPFAQSADLAGSLLLSFLMMWLASALVDAWLSGELRRKAVPARLVLPVLALLAGIGYGAFRVQQVSRALQDESRPLLPVALVQGNISLEQKHDQEQLLENVRVYRQLTQSALSSAALVVWPETVYLQFLPDDLGRLPRESVLAPPATATGSLPALLFGSLSFDAQQAIYNGAFLVLPDGSVPSPYHKQILMPFGEYTPLGDWLPWLKDLNATAAEFAQGRGPRVFELPKELPFSSTTVSPLICYEDVAPRLSRAATLAGADVLVNMTNDAWFGPTVAPYQHNLIASFRAIENKRYLLRATNTGLTNIVNPLGKTEKTLPIFTRGVLASEIRPISLDTLYASYIGEKLSWLLLAVWAIAGIYGKLARNKS